MSSERKQMPTCVQTTGSEEAMEDCDLRAIRGKMSTSEINFRKKTLSLPTYTLTGALSDTCPVKLVTMERKGRGRVVARSLASHQGESGSIPSGAAPELSQVGIASDDATVGGFTRRSPALPRPTIPTLLHAHLTSPTSALKTSTLRATPISPLRLTRYFSQNSAAKEQNSMNSEAMQNNSQTPTSVNFERAHKRLRAGGDTSQAEATPTQFSSDAPAPGRDSRCEIGRYLTALITPGVGQLAPQRRVASRRPGPWEPGRPPQVFPSQACIHGGRQGGSDSGRSVRRPDWISHRCVALASGRRVRGPPASSQPPY
ncbi:hypothetical protein PR048_009630 [Dryococelus australis]|uniref:Uncharacterized protein n=1 Tax=Dryococelus australis TaxID=614101 RepID=A0ABQ9I289_9NEOP|nr:hypothetical protein PR048_009630 [Dryococelus australis]